MDAILVFLVIWIVLQIYFLPTAIALYRNSEGGSWICLLNLIAGWTLLGWVAAFVWACVAKPVPRRRVALR